MATMGNRIKNRRQQLNLSLEDVGKACGVAKSTVARWEEGTEVRGEKILRLATVLNTSVDYLMGFTEDVSASHVMTQRETQLMQSLMSDTLFDLLIRQSGLKEVATTDGDRVLIIDGLLLELDPTIISEVTDLTTEFFVFLLKRRITK